MKPVLLEPAFVLHRRPYRETSYLVELFTKNHGRLSVVVRGIRKPRSPLTGLLQPFTALLVSWAGKSELKNLSHVEADGEVLSLRGERLFTGFYFNELLMGLLDQWDAYPCLYLAYQQAIVALSNSENEREEKILRIFEKRLLEELGYGLLPKRNLFLNPILSDQFYRFVPGEGFILSENEEKADVFSGKHLLAIANEEWTNEQCLQEAKRLTRLVLPSLLGEKKIHSRRLFIKLGENKNAKTKDFTGC